MKNNLGKGTHRNKKKEKKVTKQKFFVVSLFTHDFLGVDSIWMTQIGALKRALQIAPHYSKDLQDWELLQLDELRDNMLILQDKQGDDIHIREHELEKI